MMVYIGTVTNIRTKKYHINKTMEAYKKDVRLIHIFEDEWLYKKIL